MATKQEQIAFVRAVYPEALEKYKNGDTPHPYFVTGQGACETGFNLGSIPNNLFGITKGSSWAGPVKLCLTTEYFDNPNKKFVHPESVVSVEKINDKKYKYKCYRHFRVYDSIGDCLTDHLAILKKPGYADAWPYRNDPYEYAKRIVDSVGSKYATADNYAEVMAGFIRMVERIVKKEGL